MIISISCICNCFSKLNYLNRNKLKTKFKKFKHGRRSKKIVENVILLVTAKK